MHFHMHPLHELSQKSCNEYRYDRQWTYIADEEPQNAEQLGIAADLSSVCEFVIYIGLLETPAHKEDGQKTAEGHKNVGREIVEEVKEISSADLYM